MRCWRPRDLEEMAVLEKYVTPSSVEKLQKVEDTLEVSAMHGAEVEAGHAQNEKKYSSDCETTS